MTIGIDKNSINAIKKGNEYVYLFDDEPLEELMKTGLHCINYRNCNFVDINLTNYNVDCIKQAKITDKDYDKLEKKEYKIGIIIPNYNYEHTIDKCLKSILAQSYKHYEVIFIDDCSTDKSVEIAKYYENEMPIKVIQLKQKRLNGGARNEAYLHLSDDVDYVYYIDSDDWLLDEYCLEKINNKL